MGKSKLPLKEIVHEGATACFDWMDYLNEEPPDYSFGFDESLWEKDNKLDEFKELQKYHIDAIEYIKTHEMDSREFDFEFQEEYLKNKHYLFLSILGNKIEYILFSQMTPKQLTNHFEGDDSYYTLENIKEAIEFVQKKLEGIS